MALTVTFLYIYLRLNGVLVCAKKNQGGKEVPVIDRAISRVKVKPKTWQSPLIKKTMKWHFAIFFLIETS